MGLMMNEARVLPNHIGFIVDGNRRWARERGLPTYNGHKRGFEVLKQMAYVAQARGIKHVSAFIFSTENWRRSEDEVGYLMKLFLSAFQNDMRQLVKDGFRIIFLGRRDHLSKQILDAIAETERDSANNTSTTLALCFNYGGRAEIVDAAKHLAAAVQQGDVSLKDFADSDLDKYMYHPELPDLDMVVRTSGEERISGFMLWRSAYAEFLFLRKNWPDMTEADFDACLDEFAHRQRRFGK